MLERGHSCLVFNRDITRESEDLREWILRQPEERPTPKLQVGKLNMMPSIPYASDYNIGVIVMNAVFMVWLSRTVSKN